MGRKKIRTDTEQRVSRSMYFNTTDQVRVLEWFEDIWMPANRYNKFSYAIRALLEKEWEKYELPEEEGGLLPKIDQLSAQVQQLSAQVQQLTQFVQQLTSNVVVEAYDKYATHEVDKSIVNYLSDLVEDDWDQ